MKPSYVFVIALALSGLASAQDGTRRELHAAPGQKLTLDLDTGAGVRITGWDRNQVSMDARVRGRDARDVQLDMRSVSGGVEITSRYGRARSGGSSSVEIELHVPRRFDVSLDSMGGAVSIDGVEGELRGKTMGGELTLTNVKGVVGITTMGGEITLKNSQVDGSLHTMGGRVLFEDVVGAVKGSSMGGHVIYRNVRSTPTSPASSKDEVKISTMGGEIKVDDAPAGADVHTMGGEIRIRSARRHVKANTMGGDVTIDAIDGWVEASTMGGNVSITMVGDAQGDRHAKLTSMGGEITLTVPPELSMQLDVELAYTKNSRQNYQIRSDFPLRLEATDAWDYGHGSARKYIRGKGSVAGGRNAIRIETINGNVTIRKGR